MSLFMYCNFQRDLVEGFRVLIRLSEKMIQGVLVESDKMELRFHKDRLDKQIESGFHELGKQIHHLYVFQGVSDFLKDFKIHELIDQTNQLINERKELFEEQPPKEELKSQTGEDDEGKPSLKE